MTPDSCLPTPNSRLATDWPQEGEARPRRNQEIRGQISDVRTEDGPRTKDDGVFSH